MQTGDPADDGEAGSGALTGSGDTAGEHAFPVGEGNPGPWSRTVTSPGATVTSTGDPAGPPYRWAFSTRFRTACASRSGSPSTTTGSAVTVTLSWSGSSSTVVSTSWSRRSGTSSTRWAPDSSRALASSPVTSRLSRSTSRSASSDEPPRSTVSRRVASGVRSSCAASARNCSCWSRPRRAGRMARPDSRCPTAAAQHTSAVQPSASQRTRRSWSRSLRASSVPTSTAAPIRSPSQTGAAAHRSRPPVADGALSRTVSCSSSTLRQTSSRRS